MNKAPAIEGNPPSRLAVILTALPIEYQAIRSHLADVYEIPHPLGTVYERGVVEGDGDRRWEVAMVEVGAGNAAAAFETERAINFFQPSALFFVGIAGGIKDVDLCDVVAATKVYGYESGKETDSFLPRPDVGQSSYSMVQRAKAEARKEEWQKRIAVTLPIEKPNVFVEPIAAGEKVVASRRSATHDFLRTSYNDAVAVEMEGRGCLVAAHANAPVPVLIVRGISDLLSGKMKTDVEGYQEYAAHSAAAFAFQVLTALGEGETATSARYTIVLSGTIDEFDRTRAEAIVSHLRELTGDVRLTLHRIEEGSVRLVLEGSLDGFKKIRGRFAAGELSSELGCDVLDVVRESEDLDETVSTAPSRESLDRPTTAINVDLSILSYVSDTTSFELDEHKLEDVIGDLQARLEREDEAQVLVAGYDKIKQLLAELEKHARPPDLRNRIIKVGVNLDEAQRRNKKLKARARHRRDQGELLAMLSDRLDVVQETFGNVLEIALHDVRDYNQQTRKSTLIKLAGNITGRKEGESPMTDLGHWMLKPQFRRDSVVNYRSRYRGREFKGTSILVRDARGAVYGVLCFNLDLESIKRSDNSVLHDLGRCLDVKDEMLAADPDELVQELIDNLMDDEEREAKGEGFVEYLVHQTQLFQAPYRELAIAKAAPRLGIDARRLVMLIDSYERDRG